MKNLLRLLSERIPFEIKRPTSALSVLFALVISGFLSKIGEWLFDLLIKFVSPQAPYLWKIIITIITFSIPINVFGIIIFVIVLFPVYRFIDKKWIQNLGRVTLFEDDFSSGNKGWNLNYWGSNNPNKTCRYENSALVFEATETDLTDSRKENGAFFDLRNGIYEGSKYDISCWVKSEGHTTMGFQLWLHDTTGRSDAKFPTHFYTPGTRLEEIKSSFIATSSQGLRIHLHTKAGSGKIIVHRVVVVKAK